MASDGLKATVTTQCPYPGCPSVLAPSQRYCQQHQSLHMKLHDQTQARDDRPIRGDSRHPGESPRSPEEQLGQPRVDSESHNTGINSSMHPTKSGQSGPGLPVNSRLELEFAQQATKTAKKTVKTSSVGRAYMAPSRTVRTQPSLLGELPGVDSGRFERQSYGEQRSSDAATRAALFSLHPSKGAGSPSYSHLRTLSEPRVPGQYDARLQRLTQFIIPTAAQPKAPSTAEEDGTAAPESHVSQEGAPSPSSTAKTGDAPSLFGFSSTRFAPVDDLPKDGHKESTTSSTSTVTNGHDRPARGPWTSGRIRRPLPRHSARRSSQKKWLNIPAAVKRVPTGLRPGPIQTAFNSAPAQSPWCAHERIRVLTPKPSQAPTNGSVTSSSTTLHSVPAIIEPAASVNQQRNTSSPDHEPADGSSRGPIATSVGPQPSGPSTSEDLSPAVNGPRLTENRVSAVGEPERNIDGLHGQEPLPEGAISHVSQDAHRQQTVATFDQAKFDAAFYSQALAGPPPPGVTVSPTKQKHTPPPGEDSKLYLHIDPRIHWPRRWTDEWYENKMKEIRARGGRKANWGRAAQRMREQRLREEAQSQAGAKVLAEGPPPTSHLREPAPWMYHRRIDFEDMSEDELPDYVLENAAWARACAWMRSNAEERRRRTKASAGEALRRILSSKEGQK